MKMPSQIKDGHKHFELLLSKDGCHYENISDINPKTKGVLFWNNDDQVDD